MTKKHKLTVLILFSIPTAITLLIFGYILGIKDTELKNNKTLIFSATITQSAGSLIHTIQIERGLSAGFLASKNTNIQDKTKLLKQQKLTDKFYKGFMLSIQNNQEKKNFNKLIQDKELLLEVNKEMSRVKMIRTKILSHSISFDNEIKYYSNINTKLLDIMHNFAIFDTKNNYEGVLIYDIETLKENLGLERAYIYNQLLSNKIQNEKLNKTKRLITTQDIIRKKLLLDSTPQIKELYNNFVDKASLNEIQKFRDDFLCKKLDSSDAKKWFVLSTNFIDRHEALSINISDIYLKNIQQNYSKSQTVMYIIVALFVFYIILILILVYTLNNILARFED